MVNTYWAVICGHKRCDLYALIMDCEMPLQMKPDHDPGVAIVFTSLTGRNLEFVSVKGYRVVIGDRAFILEAEDIVRVEICRPGTICGTS